MLSHFRGGAGPNIKVAQNDLKHICTRKQETYVQTDKGTDIIMTRQATNKDASKHCRTALKFAFINICRGFTINLTV